MKIFFKINLLVFISLLVISCGDEYLDTTPQNQASAEQIAENPLAAQRLLDGFYLSLASYSAGGSTNHDDFGIMSTLGAADLMSNDEVQRVSHWFGAYYSFTGQILTNSRTLVIWRTFYNQIFQLNNLINEIKSVGVTEENKYILGQALMLRAYSYHQLTRFYTFSYIGHENDLAVPLVSGGETTGQPRATVAAIYESIKGNITEALPLLNGYSRTNKSQIDSNVAKAIASDIYLWIGDYQKASLYANQARSGYSLMSKSDYLSTGFSNINNSEAMWGYDHTSQTTGIYASFFSHWDSTNQGYAGLLGVYKQIDKRLYDSMSDTDYRKQNFNGSSTAPYTFNGNTKNYPAYTNFKFKDPSFFEGDYIYLRSSLLYYIEAEALAKLGNETQAKQVLYDITSQRDPDYVLSSNNGNSLIDEIILQKRIEMWGEGYAWFDQKRLQKPLTRNYLGSNHAAFGKIDQDINANRWRFQIPLLEMNNNSAITENNP